jgi:hypothetical protein
MIFGLFTTAASKGALGQNESGQSAPVETAAAETVAVMEPPAAPTPASQPAPAAAQAPAKACPQCGSTEPWGISSWCPNCFYHPRLGQAMAPPTPPDPEVRHFLPGHTAQPESFAAVLKTIPLWTYPIWMGMAAILALSLFESVKLPRVGAERAIWTVAQASLGLIAAGVAHVLTFFIAIPSMEKHGPFDLFLKPFDFWRYTIRKLPTGAWRLWMITWGLTAAFSALVLIGGIRYSAMFETKSKKKNSWIQTSQIVPQERQADWRANA